MMAVVLSIVLKYGSSLMMASMLYSRLDMVLKEMKAAKAAKSQPKVKISYYTPGVDDLDDTECEVVG